MKDTMSIWSLFVVACFCVIAECYNGCPDVDPMDHTVHLPHPTDCTLFYKCDHGYPVLFECPAKLHFNPVLEVCDWPDHAGCTAGQYSCSALVHNENNNWMPSSCSLGSSKVGDTCTIQCSPGYEAVGGTSVQCTSNGWLGSGGLGQIPQCKRISSCTPLGNSDAGHWTPTYCSQESAVLGTACTLLCHDGYENVGGSTVSCTDNGWWGMNGYEQIPVCKKISKCRLLGNSESGHWTPNTCTQEPALLGMACTLNCHEGYEVSGGTTVSCTENGWWGMNGYEQIPECTTVSDLGEAFIDRINKTVHGRAANMLFLVDMSGSVEYTHFLLEIKFMKALVGAFPLADFRSAGDIAFDHSPVVTIPLSTDDTCTFMQQADGIRYNGGGTDILGALELAITEISINARHNFTLVFLITDGESQTDPTSAADKLKRAGHQIFTVGIANYSPEQLIPLSSIDENGQPIFFGIDSFETFEKVAEYLETAYNSGGINCS